MDPYLRILAAVALVLVVSDAVLDLAWLTLFPAVGILFAVGGTVAASAADRAASARAFVRRALTSLLLPFWLFATAVVATMLTIGWQAAPFERAEPFSWSRVWLWVVPISDPPASLEGVPWVLTAWHVPTYLWLVLATPALLWLFRRWPLRILSLPVLTVLVLTAGIATLTGGSRDVVIEVCVYACCWMVGFARHDGRLARLSLRVALPAGVALLGSGLGYAVWRQDGSEVARIGDLPLAALLYSLGAVILVLRVPWRGDRVRGGWPGAVMSAVGARTLTVFLWAPAAAAAAVPALALSPLAEYHTDDASGAALRFAATWVLLLAVVLLVGWAEDVGAGLWPTLLGARRPGERPRPAELERTFVVRDNVVRDNLLRGLPAAEPAEPSGVVRSGGGASLPRDAG
ncbi:acyltransferase family protein [Candidatus Blastococcus massiliensis]|uniref:acyltransferase family protein n=1 Tax=Candidatus Blastococcus massiliensis TaxID=1470358 RepID=UPI0004B96B77|nr:acyltransferase family protein [Candidatus Blastococcus massiliensis]